MKGNDEDRGEGKGDKGAGSSHGEHGISYSKIGTQTHPIKSSDTGSPPPTSATASGSTSTPTSISGLSSGGSGQIKRESPTINVQHSQDPSLVGQSWSVSVPEPIITQRYTSSQEGSQPLVHSEESQEKRYNPTSYPSAIKLLVSNNVAGSIIGRAGQTISELQTQSSARIKLSQTGDFYPGTQDRVCLVQGQLENVKGALRLLLERLYMLQEQHFSQHVAWQPKQGETSSESADFNFVVRLLVPSSCCGMIIGKGGSNIKQMEETSGVSSVRLSPKESSDPSSPTAALASGTSERIVTLTGPSMESCLNCSYIVIDGMTSHHDISRYTNMTTSYSRVIVPPGSFNPISPTGRPVLVVPPGGDSSMWESPGQYGQFVPKRSNSSPDLAGQMMWDQRGGPAPRMPTDVSGAPMSREQMQQFSPVFETLPPATFHDIQGMIQPQLSAPGQNPVYLEPPSMTNSASAPDLALQLQESLRLSNTPPSATGPNDFSHFAHQMPQPTPPDFTAQVLVPDSLIGSILGRGGRTLNELQMHSNTRIRISQRGEYMPGTRNRIVTIRGPTAQSVSYAQYLMSQRMVLPPTANFSPTPMHPSQMQHMPRHMHHSMPTQAIQQQQYEGHPQSVYIAPEESMQNPTGHGEANLSQSNSKDDLPQT